jgi:hypothetical protein
VHDFLARRSNVSAQQSRRQGSLLREGQLGQWAFKLYSSGNTLFLVDMTIIFKIGTGNQSLSSTRRGMEQNVTKNRLAYLRMNESLFSQDWVRRL